MENSKGNFLIIGGTSGIGHALCEILSKAGSKVFSASRKGAEFDHTVDGVSYLKYDAIDEKQSLEGLPEVLHGMAYCPGSITLKPFHRLSSKDFLADYEINVLGAVRAIKFALPALKKAERSSIVLFSTVAATVGLNFHTSIASAKAAVEGLGKSLAAELAHLYIRVNVIAPSLTDTPLAGNLLSTPEKKEAAG
ncbi:MAG: SDR family oxidoreductase, partial [Cyclobacteriaceae bacterium]